LAAVVVVDFCNQDGNQKKKKKKREGSGVVGGWTTVDMACVGGIESNINMCCDGTLAIHLLQQRNKHNNTNHYTP
jgi:hypothetical protein